MKNADLAQLPLDFGVMDYLTSQQDDYRNPYPSVTKPVKFPLLHTMQFDVSADALEIRAAQSV
jgi:hypothetical protein